MSKLVTRTLAVSALALGLASPALAQRTASGSFNGIGWTATSRIVGQTGTGTAAAVPPGNPIYNATMPQKSGVAALIMDYGAAGRFICTGSLISATRIVTAAHCVSGGTNNGGLSGLQSVTAHFYAGNNPGQPGNVYNPDVVTSNPTSPFGDPVNTVSIGASGVNVHQAYTGEVIDQNDIAVIVLSQAAPTWANVYDIDYTTPLEGSGFNVAGYGGRSSLGGSVGADLGTGRLREGDNRYDFRLGDADFGGTFTDPGFFGAQAENSWLSDFDNGLAVNDASCRLAVEGFGIAPNGKYCNLGVGAREVGVAGGDSGGPQFINGKLSSVTSYGLTFFGLGDIDCFDPQNCNLNSTFGEFSGFVPLAFHQDFIAQAVPEPQSWALMILGFGAVGFGLRRARANRVSFA
jgi:hypothetical protein